MNNEETENQGRLPTPVLRHLKKQKTRHHLDLTTPCVKGILLSAPNDMQMSASTSGIYRKLFFICTTIYLSEASETIL